jgi:hypothetical protein
MRTGSHRNVLIRLKRESRGYSREEGSFGGSYGSVFALYGDCLPSRGVNLPSKSAEHDTIVNINRIRVIYRSIFMQMEELFFLRAVYTAP